VESWQEVLRERVPQRLLEINQRAFELGYAVSASTGSSQPAMVNS
jgi:Pyruvate/2-oxoacid:ferredoxin oxidoreductase gamma subunit